MRMLFRFIAFLFLLLVNSALFSQKQLQTIPPDLENYISKVLTTFEVPGVSVSIVKDGKVLLTKGYGVKKMNQAERVDEHTLFSIASNSKAFTATALAILVEEGKIKWDDPVINYLPWFKMSDPYVTTHITVRDLLVHHSGLGAYSGDLLLFPPTTFSRKEIISKISQLPLVHDFRTTYAYDNVLYVTAGELIAEVSGMPWEDFIKTKIFDKAGMNESHSRFSDFKGQPNIATGHNRYNGKVQVIDHFADQMIGDAGDPAGGITTNAVDMAKWLITQLDSGKAPNDQKIFSPSSTKQLWKIITPIPVNQIKENLKPAQSNFSGYALAFRIYNYKEYKIIGHGGMLDGFVSQIALVPDLDLGISVFTNQESTGAYYAIIYHILDYYMKNKPFDWIGGYKKLQDSAFVKLKKEQEKELIKPVSNSKPSLPLEKYTGVYNDNLLGEVVIANENGSMKMRFTESPQFVATLKHFQYDTFIAHFSNKDLKADSYVTFSLNPDGSIDQVKLKIIDPDSLLSFSELLLKPVKEKNKS
jgi:CubicO group peptidase (beta-lactamase class C family)